MTEKNFSFDFYATYFNDLNYTLYDSSNYEKITIENYANHLPKYGSIDVLAIPN